MPADHRAGDRAGIGVGEGDQRVLAAQLEQDGLDVVGRRPASPPGPVGTLPISATLATRGGWPAPPGRAVAGHDVEDPGREQAVDQFGEPQRGQRRLLGRLDDHRVAGRRAGPRACPRRT